MVIAPRLLVGVFTILLAMHQATALIADCLIAGKATMTGSQTCQVCRDGMSPSADMTICLACAPGCFSCFPNSTCVACYLAFSLTNGVCNPGCRDNCTRCGVTGCEECQRGFFINVTSGNCLKCQDRCIECSRPNSCDECADEFQKKPIYGTGEDFFCDDKVSKAGLWIVLSLAIILLLAGIAICFFCYNPLTSPLYRYPNSDHEDSNLSIGDQGPPVPVIPIPLQPLDEYGVPLYATRPVITAPVYGSGMGPGYAPRPGQGSILVNAPRPYQSIVGTPMQARLPPQVLNYSPFQPASPLQNVVASQIQYTAGQNISPPFNGMVSQVRPNRPLM